MSGYIYKSFDFVGESIRLVELFKEEKHLFFLDSSMHNCTRGRYSFIGFDPFKIIEAKGKNAVDELKNAFEEFKDNRNKEDREELNNVTPFTCGVVGFVGYDYGLYQEKIKLHSVDDLGLPDLFFGFYDCVITIDHFARKIYIASSGKPHKEEKSSRTRAAKKLRYVSEKISLFLTEGVRHAKNIIRRNNAVATCFELTCNFKKNQYLDTVRKALAYIEKGDIYQVNLSQRFSFDFAGADIDGLEIYRELRKSSLAPFAGYFDCGNFQIISSSPERFLKKTGSIVQTRPMKGTRPRGKNKLEDYELRKEIEASKKEKAELLMITDLERNDLGKVCEYGSVCVKEIRTIEEYRNVYQATSTVEGILRKDKNCFDLIKACFPGGSITGCPKIRSMEIIEELEPTRRAIYTGILGYVSFDGNMDFNILIRTILMHENRIDFQVGGGIVADSLPEREYEETLVKAKGMKDCLKKVFNLNTLLRS